MAAKPSSLLLQIKELLGIPAVDTVFDGQLVTYINMAFEMMHQFGFGPTDTYVISATSGDIEEFLPDDEGIRGLVIIYIYTRVRLLFDPPSSSFVLSSLQTMVREYEWRLTNYVPKVVT